MIVLFKTDATTRSEQRNLILLVMRHGGLGIRGFSVGLKQKPKPRENKKLLLLVGAAKKKRWCSFTATSATQSCAAACSGAEGQSGGAEGATISKLVIMQ